MVQAAIEDTAVDNIPVSEEATSPVEVTQPVVEAATEPVVEAASVVETPDPRAWLNDAPEEDLLSHERINDLLRRREKSAEDRASARLKREAGNNESVQQVLSRLLQSAVESGGDETELRKIGAQAVVFNRQYQAIELAKELPDALMRNYTIPVEAREAALSAREDNDWDGYATKLIDGAVESKVAELRKADEARVKKAIADGVAAELKARQIETAPKLETPLVAPSGGTASGADQINSMTDADRAYNRGTISGEQYRGYAKQFGVELA